MSMTDSSLRPFRELCPEADPRDAMSDGEFWEHVFGTEGMPDIGDDEPDEPDVQLLPACSICGSTGPCGFDIDGRPLIHATAVPA